MSEETRVLEKEIERIEKMLGGDPCADCIHYGVCVNVVLNMSYNEPNKRCKHYNKNIYSGLIYAHEKACDDYKKSLICR
jgi:hypothetical protein